MTVNKIDGWYHKAECDGSCTVIGGCAPQWQPEEIERMKLNRIKPQLRELTSAERKACPVVTGVLHYFPDAIMAVSRVSKAGNDKHNPGEPLHWARGKSNDHLDSEGRHLLTSSATDPDSGQPEAAHKAWRALADLQISEEKRLIAAGIRPMSGVTE